MTVRDFEITHSGRALAVRMRCLSEDRSTYDILFKSVTRIKLAEVSYPFHISRLEILDTYLCSCRDESLFLVTDGDGEKLSFYCESIEICDGTDE